MTPASLAKNPRRVSAVVGIVIVVLYFSDRALARLESGELAREAQSRYQVGMAALRAGRSDQAVDLLRRAHALARDNREYTLGLADALAASGIREEAESRLREVLREDSNDGRANLSLARLLVAKSKSSQGIAFYHRAIYGTWRTNPEDERVSVRLELARYLAKVDRPQELLSELLLLQEVLPRHEALGPEVAHLFLEAGSATRAAEIYRERIRSVPTDAQAYAGVGEADLLAGDYRAAETMFLTALKHSPDDAKIAGRVSLASSLARLDPTPRRLSSSEKYNRSMELLRQVQTSLEKCPATDADLTALKAEAEQAEASKPKPPIDNDLAEERLSLAERLWTAPRRTCPQSSAASAAEPITMLMEKLRQTK